MRQITVTVYEFNELSEGAKKNALNSFQYINVHDGWWDSILEDSKSVGVSIMRWDADNYKGTSCSFDMDCMDVCKAIVENFGDKDAGFLKKKCTEYINDEDGEVEPTEIRKEIELYYGRMFVNDYMFRVSDAEVAETIQENDYLFDEKGNEFKYR